MVIEETCVGPFYCRALTGECCEVYLSNGIITCPIRGCTNDTNRQSDVAGSQRFSIRDIFFTTLVTTLMYEVLTNIGATTTTTTTTTITTTTTTATTTTPIITSSKHDQFYSKFFLASLFQSLEPLEHLTLSTSLVTILMIMKNSSSSLWRLVQRYICILISII